MGWNKGAILAQACHASTAVVFAHRDDPLVVDYFADVDKYAPCFHSCIAANARVHALHVYCFPREFETLWCVVPKKWQEPTPTPAPHTHIHTFPPTMKMSVRRDIRRRVIIVPSWCSLRKVVLEAKSEAELLALSRKLTDASIVHKLWVRCGPTLCGTSNAFVCSHRLCIHLHGSGHALFGCWNFTALSFVRLSSQRTSQLAWPQSRTINPLWLPYSSRSGSCDEGAGGEDVMYRGTGKLPPFYIKDSTPLGLHPFPSARDHVIFPIAA